MIEVGCPEPKKLDDCPPSLEAEPVALLEEHYADLADRTVAVRGRLVGTPTRCTLVYCKRNDGTDRPLCCNKCTREMAVRDETGRAQVLVDTDDILCRGDESLTCCSRDIEGPVIVRGRVAPLPKDPGSRSKHELLDATVCRIAGSLRDG